MHYNLLILSYHRFGEEESEYAFSRTYDQFRHDLIKKEFDWITIDDGHRSQIRACEMMKEMNVRAKIFITPGLVGTPGYCSWDEIKFLSRFHDIENHSFDHVKLPKLSTDEISSQVDQAQQILYEKVGRLPRYFAAPWNDFNEEVELIVNSFGLQLMKDRVNIKNDSK